MKKKTLPEAAHSPAGPSGQPPPFTPRGMAGAIRAIDALTRSDPEEHQRTFDYLKVALDQHRTQGNKLFPLFASAKLWTAL